MRMHMKRLWWLLLPVAVLALDYGTKAQILARFREGEVLAVIPRFFNLTLVFNPGAIFGSLAHAPASVRTLVFSLAGLLAIGYFGYEFLRESTPRLQRIALGLILGGALGNGLDRLRHGQVVDFLDFVFGHWHYWAFNLADSAIVCGALLMGLSLLPKRGPTH